MTEATDRRVGIIGAGHAGGTLALGMRAAGWQGPIDLFGDEAVAPYQRPPLSKAWLKGGATLSELLLRPADAYATERIGLHLGVPVTTLDGIERRIERADGSSFAFDVVVLATGARARTPPLPGIELAGVHRLRDMKDADGLRAVCASGRHLVVLGGGFVGLEVAAVAREAGAEVAIVEQAPRLLARSSSPALAEEVRRLHERQGVAVHLGVGATAIVGDSAGHVSGLALADRRLLTCDALLVGVGAEPNVALALAAGLECEGGILVDDVGRSSVPSIYALGDCTVRPLAHTTGRLRLESVPSALEQARRLTAHLCAQPTPAHEVPWFWSNQYAHKLQIAGMVGDAAHSVRRAGPEPKCTIVHLAADGRVCAIEALDAPGDFMAGRRAIGVGTRPDPHQLASLDLPLKQLFA